MDYQTAYKKLKQAKTEALENSTNIKVGRLELNTALEALEIADELTKIFEKVSEKQKEAGGGETKRLYCWQIKRKDN